MLLPCSSSHLPWDCNSKMMALGGRGGGGADELLSFLEREMIRGPGEEVEEEGVKLDRC